MTKPTIHARYLQDKYTLCGVKADFRLVHSILVDDFIECLEVNDTPTGFISRTKEYYHNRINPCIECKNTEEYQMALLRYMVK